MVSIKVVGKKIKDVWDVQTATYVLRMCGTSSTAVKGISQEEIEEYRKKITLYLWKKIKEQFPEIEKFCNEEEGGFNRCEKRHYGTPIINIYGNFYLQLICENNKNAWSRKSVSLEPYRFEFNEEGYFKGLVVDAINKAIRDGYSKDRFKKLIEALNKEPNKEKILTIQTKGKDIGKVNIHEVKTKII